MTSYKIHISSSETLYFRNYLSPLCGWPDAFAHKSNQSSIKKSRYCAPYFALFLTNLSLPSVESLIKNVISVAEFSIEGCYIFKLSKRIWLLEKLSKILQVQSPKNLNLLGRLAHLLQSCFEKYLRTTQLNLC